VTSIVVTGVPAIQKVLEQLDGRDRYNAERRAVRAASKPFIAALKAEAAAANVPRSFQKVPAAKISTDRGPGGRDVRAVIRPKSPLFNIFEPGAGAHDISADFMGGPAGGGSWSREGRKRPSEFAARGTVRHPGMRARPLLPGAFATAEPAAMDAFANAIFGSGISE
jgi:hypothetical protein